MAYYAMETPKEHIEEIRKKKFSIGSEVINPLTEELHQAVKHLSAELYAKDVHFLMELIQNAEDNEYPAGMDPSVEFVITSRDITGTGAPATLLMFNNEKGFSDKNIESICSVGRSTKKRNRKRGYIGEKGIGFKSVFLITAQPHIFSNGYQIKFNEEPCTHCNLGYIVPEWVKENPSLSDIQKIYGLASTLPTTTLVLPLKPDKVKPVKQQLSNIHPEVLLFLSKIKRLSVREDNEDPRNNTVSAIAINSETNFVTRKNIDAESYTLHLSANGDQFDKECSYSLWRQKFPVKQENKEERRMDVEEWVITLAFPIGERLQRGTTSPGVYAFLPTEMVTNFPFIIQADFLLASSRETMRFDNKWNQGILNCVPSAFVNALISMVKLIEAPVSSLPRMFGFLPINISHYQALNDVRESIRARLAEEDVIPSQSGVKQKCFHKPREVGRLMPRFWNILKKANLQGVGMKNLSHHGINVLNSSFDKEEYDQILNFLGVKPVDMEWYGKCIQSSNLVLGVSEDVYCEILFFVAENWSSKFYNTNIRNIPLIKYVDLDGKVTLCSIIESAQSYNQRVVCLADCLSWLIDWNSEFRCVTNRFFVPKCTFDALLSCSNKELVLKWLIDQVKVVNLTVYEYACVLINCLNNNRKLVLAYAHFLFHSFSKKYLSLSEINYLCGRMPLVNNYGAVSTIRKGVLVPANGSQWAELTVSDPWKQEGYVELGEDYLLPVCYAGQSTPVKQFTEFLKLYVAASDIPYISPPNSGIRGVSSLLPKENAFLLLDWIKNLNYLRSGIPQKFLRSIKEGSWLKVTMNGSSSHRPPSQSFFLTSTSGNSCLGTILLRGSVLVDIPLVDESFYGEGIKNYKEQLKTVGVMFEYKEACEFIGKRLMSLAASSNVTRDNVLSILNFIRFMRDQYLPLDSFIQSIKEGCWLKTSHGYRSPGRSVLYDPEWKIASQISNIPFIDQDYYGVEIICFKVELQLLGVKVGFNQDYQLVIDNLKSSSYLTSLTADAVLFILSCMRHSESSGNIARALRHTKWLKTNAGYKCPGESFLFDLEWGCLLLVFKSFPIVDGSFYGSIIVSFKKELKQLGVVVDFENAAKAFVCHFKQHAPLISKDQALLFLSCYRKLRGISHKFPPEFVNCVREDKWLKTRFGDYRSPRECILFGPDWESISPITLLPFIDDRFYGMDILEYKEELKSMGTIVAFEHGVHFVAAGLHFPSDPCKITRANVLSVLKCIQILQENNYSFPETFSKKVSQKWLKTCGGAGYSSPSQSLLFDSLCESYSLQQTDGPFIDEEFYGSEIKSYKKELNAIGVPVDVIQGCPLLASHIDCQPDFTTIVRIYNFLAEVKWMPNSGVARRIWIPNGNENVQWVSPGECVLHDKDDLFSSRMNVLEKHFEHKLLSFFSSAFAVKSNPSIDDYCNIWKVWESSGQKLSKAECCAFWGYVVKHWSSKTEKLLADCLAKLPVDSGNEGILLFDKQDVFLADDLQLKDVFEQSSCHSLFVWYPQPSLPALPRTKLLESYRKIGVRTISESVQKEELSLGEGVELRQVTQKHFLVGKGMIKLILGFLAFPTIQMDAEKRHETVKCLLNLTILESAQPISVRYTLSLISGETVDVSVSQMIRWDRESGKLFTRKIDWSDGHKNRIEYATHFAEIISKGVLWDREEHTNAMSELIKLAFLLEFNEEAVEFLMKSKNMQIFKEDEEFLSASFPCDSE